MAVLFGTQEWADAMVRELNSSQAYKEAAKNWEGGMYVIVEPDASFKHRIIGYYDLWHGECRPACVIKYKSEKSPKYQIWGQFTVMSQVLEKKLDVVQATMTGKLKVNGDMAQAMKMLGAAVEFVDLVKLRNA